MASEVTGMLKRILNQLSFNTSGSQTTQLIDAGGEVATITGGKLDVNATVSTVGLATSIIQTDGTQKSQLVDAGGEVVTITGGKLDVNASVDTTGLATSAKQLPDGHTVALSATDNGVLDDISSAASRLISSACDASGAGAVSGTTALLAGAEYNATPPTVADTNQVALQTDDHGRLLVGLPIATITTLTPPAAITGFATSIKQSDGSQTTQIVDASGAQFNAGVCNGCVVAALSDTVDLTHPGYIQPRLLTGTVVVTDVNGNDSTIILDLKETTLFRVKRVKSTGTTASMGIVVYY